MNVHAEPFTSHSSARSGIAVVTPPMQLDLHSIFSASEQ